MYHIVPLEDQMTSHYFGRDTDYLVSFCFLCNHISIVTITMKSADKGCRICQLTSLSVDILQVTRRSSLAELHAVILNLAKTNTFKERYLLTSRLEGKDACECQGLVTYGVKSVVCLLQRCQAVHRGQHGTRTTSSEQTKWGHTDLELRKFNFTGTNYAVPAVCCDGESSLVYFIHQHSCNFRVQPLIIIVK